MSLIRKIFAVVALTVIFAPQARAQIYGYIPADRFECHRWDGLHWWQGMPSLGDNRCAAAPYRINKLACDVRSCLGQLFAFENSPLAMTMKGPNIRGFRKPMRYCYFPPKPPAPPILPCLCSLFPLPAPCFQCSATVGYWENFPTMQQEIYSPTSPIRALPKMPPSALPDEEVDPFRDDPIQANTGSRRSPTEVMPAKFRVRSISRPLLKAAFGNRRARAEKVAPREPEANGSNQSKIALAAGRSK